MPEPVDTSERLPGEPPPTTPERRLFLQRCAAALGALATLALGIPIVGYVIGAVIRRQPDAWVDLGLVERFPEKQTMLVEFLLPRMQPWDGQCRNASAYVRRREANDFQVFAVNCAHLGCPVSWFPSSGLFMCPCHGGVYYEDGSRASGPPPRGLYPYEFRVQQVEDKVEGQTVTRAHLQIKAGHVPTLHDPLRPDDAEGKA